MAGIKEFAETLEKNEELQKKLGAATDSAEVIAIMKAAGFDVTEDELMNQLSASVDAMEEGEIDDDALMDVSGGKSLSIISAPLFSSSLTNLLQRIFGSKMLGKVTNLKMTGSIQPNGITTPYNGTIISGGHEEGKNSGSSCC